MTLRHGRPAHTVRGLRKAFADMVVLDDIDFTNDGGTIFALLDPNGVGTTTAVVGTSAAMPRAVVSEALERATEFLTSLTAGRREALGYFDDRMRERHDAERLASGGDEVGAVDVAPAVFDGFDQLDDHRKPGGLRPRTLSHIGPEPDGREGRLDGGGVNLSWQRGRC